jgi:uncharacterized protein (TIGR00255 family)
MDVLELRTAMIGSIRSMTGYGSAEANIGSQRVSVEIRSVNHRFFTPSIKVPPAWTRMESDMRELLRRYAARGHVTLSVRIERDLQDGPRINVTRLQSYAAQLLAMPEQDGIDRHIDLGSLLRLPDVVTSVPVDDETTTAVDPAAVLALVADAAVQFARMREAEGGRLAQYILDRLAIIESALERLAARAPQRLREQRDRLATAVQDLVGGLAVDQQRLAQEIAILADRVDVAEELSRFASHNTACRAALASPEGDGVGKRLGFILQEMVREANTTGSKANDAQMQQDVVLIKEELERMREQVENLE